MGNALTRWWKRATSMPDEQRDLGAALTSLLGPDAWMAFNGLGYPLIQQSMAPAPEERLEGSFMSAVQQVYKQNGVVFACIAARMLIFSEARFQWQQLRGGRPGDLFGTAELGVLETPWPNATTGDLLSRMLLDADMAGNFFGTIRPPRRPGEPRRIKRLRPDWTTIIAGSETGDELDAELIGYAYQPGGPASGNDPIPLLPELVAHFAPYPDPMAHYRGMSWLTPVLREITADNASTNHKLRFFENGATPNLVVTLGDSRLTPESFQVWVDKMEASHSGVVNAYRTLYLASGADAKVVGSSFKDIDYKAVQGAGETRIAAAARVPPVIVGLSEGLDAATYSNYAQAKRAFADGTIRPLWRNAAGSLQTILGQQGGARLWYDDRDIPFLQEDRKDAAEIQAQQAQTIRTLTDAGYDPDTVVDAVLAEDFSRLKGAHQGLFSVQLQPPGTANGNGSTPAPAASTSN
jgi:phage portal protein BeeE